MFRFKTVAVILLASLLLPPTPAGCEDTPVGRVILRDTSDRYETRIPEPWLIPVSLLERRRDQWTAEEKAVVSEELYGKFLGVVEGTRDQRRSGHCTEAEGLGGRHDTHPAELRFSIAQIAGTKKTVVIAEVLFTESAWDAITFQIVTLVHLEVVTIVRAVEPVAVGDLLTVRRPWGTASVRGVTLCSYSTTKPPDPGRPTVAIPERERQQLLLVGHMTVGNSFYMSTGGFGEFPIIDGFVHYPQTYSYYRDQKPEPLAAVIAGISGTAQ